MKSLLLLAGRTVVCIVPTTVIATNAVWVVKDQTIQTALIKRTVAKICEHLRYV